MLGYILIISVELYILIINVELYRSGITNMNFEYWQMKQLKAIEIEMNSHIYSLHEPNTFVSEMAPFYQ